MQIPANPKDLDIAKFFSGSAPVVLVAGGAGFVGSHLCEALLLKKAKVIGLDNWQTGVRENIAHLEDYENFFLLEASINRPQPVTVDRLDYVVHLAGVEAYLNGEDVSIETLEANSVGTKNLLNLAKEKGARFLLASTVGVFSAGISTESTESYFGPTREQEGIFSHQEAKRFAEALTSEYGQKDKVDVRIVRLADVYGPRMMLVRNSPIGNLIKEAVYGGPLKVPGGEEIILYPVYIDDVTEGLVKALFKAGTSKKIISLSGSGVSLFTFAETIKRVIGLSPHLREVFGEKGIDVEFTNTAFAQAKVREEVLYAGREIISWKPAVRLEEGIEKTVSWFLQHKSRAKKIEQPPKKPAKKSFWEDVVPSAHLEKVRKGRLPIIFFLALLFWFFLFPFAQIAVSLSQVNFAKNDLLKGNVSSAQFWAGQSASWAARAESGFLRWGLLPGLGGPAGRLSGKSKLAQEASLSLRTAALGVSELETLVQGVLGEEPFDPQIPADNLLRELVTLDRQLAFLEAEAGQDDIFSRTFDFSSAREIISGLSAVLPYTGDLLGVAEKRTYLLLLQNNMELRPTGGFIGSFALVTFEKGRLINLEVFDVYSADGQLKGHVEPPAPIKEHLGEANWFLRDSNWSPHFPTSAARAAWFIDKELGQEVYGVVGIDLELAKELLRTYGPIKLSDFGEEVGADNLYEKTQFAVEGDFFPGSRAKKNFLTALTRELLSRIFAKDEGALQFEKLAPAGKAVLSALQSRHMTLWFQNTQVASTLAKVGWDGGVRHIRCQASAVGCAADYLMIVEANLGVNKANYFLDRNYSLEISAEGDRLVHKLTATYKNRSEGNTWPGGDYKNYARVFAPEGASFIKAFIVNPEDSQTKELEADRTREQGKRAFGVLATVPAGQARQLVVSWEIPLPENNQELVLLWQKQLGTPADPVWLLAQFGEGSTVVEALPASSLTTQSSVGYNTELAQDLVFNIKWEQQ